MEPVESTPRDVAIIAAKSIRKRLDAVLQEQKGYVVLLKTYNTGAPEHGEAIAQAILSQRESEMAIMRLGMVLKVLNPENTPYPNSYNPENTIVDPTADGLKL